MTKEDIDRIASEYFDGKESEHEMEEVFDLAKQALEERKEGRWNYIGNGCNGLYQCSVCRTRRRMFDKLDKHCPECATRMKNAYIKKDVPLDKAESEDETG